jgi:hypothetical protein
VEITIRGRLEVAKDGPITVTVAKEETARKFTLLLPDDPVLRKAATALNGKTALVTGRWEQKWVTLPSRLQFRPSTQVVLINGVEKVVPVSGKAVWETQKKVVELVRVKSVLAAPAP